MDPVFEASVKHKQYEAAMVACIQFSGIPLEGGLVLPGENWEGIPAGSNQFEDPVDSYQAEKRGKVFPVDKCTYRYKEIKKMSMWN